MNEIKIKIEQLKEKINLYDHNYYVKAESLVSDYEYDKLFKELINLEAQYPDFIEPNSPTQRVSGEPIKGFQTIKHNIPMLSLANTYTKEDVLVFDKRINKLLEGKDYNYYAEMKFDGVSMSLQYKDGSFDRAVTRGNGLQGDDVTNNIRTIKMIPLKVNEVYVGGKQLTDFEVRGEVYISDNDFLELNKIRLENGEKLFANSRNLTAGSIKLLDHKEAVKRPLKIVCYYLFSEQIELNTQYNNIEILEQLGFPVSNISKLCNNITEVWNYIDNWKEKRHNLGFQTDGIVIKVNSIKQQLELGSIERRNPRWAIAFKYEPERAATILNDITLQIGRTGVITPVAELEPVYLAGSTISRATLHNADFIATNDIRIGDVVIIEKGGDVIPKVSEVALDKRTNSVPYTFPTHCNCDLHSPIKQIEGEVNHYCIHPQCAFQVRKKIEHFVSNERYGGMEISGFGEKIVEKLCDLKFINDVADIYNLKNRQNELINAGFTTKILTKLMDAIENSKQNPFHQLLSALSIRHVGEKNAKTLVKQFITIDNLIEASLNELVNTNEIGEVIAKSIFDALHNDDFIKMINKLKKHGLNFTANNIDAAENNTINNTINKENNKLEGQSFVFTGELSNITRVEAAKLVEQFGGKETKSISQKTSFVVVGAKPGSKYKKALELGLNIINEEQFMELVK